VGTGTGTGGGYFDDGTPLGSSHSQECRIDSIAQTWAVLSGAADSVRARRAMFSVEEFLIKRADGLILLFTPPFDKSPLDPGYIKGYLPGVRENGGQYTHAAAWVVAAFAALGEGDKAAELLVDVEPREPCGHAGRGCTATRWSLTWRRRTCMPSLPTPAGAAGPGIRVPRAGFTAPGWNGSWASALPGTSDDATLHPQGLAAFRDRVQARFRDL